MGGTSTDVSRYDGSFDHVFETTTAGVTIQAPQLDINTVAAGGGSMLFFRYTVTKLTILDQKVCEDVGATAADFYSEI
jgi:N-methylhydantoinase A/oxoprolinase/acetone carboxylase beta subunit